MNPNENEFGKLEAKSKALDYMTDILLEVAPPRQKKELLLMKQAKSLMQSIGKARDYAVAREESVSDETLEQTIEYLGMVQTGIEQYFKDNPVKEIKGGETT